VASKAADSTNIYACGAVAHMLDIGVTARVSRVHVGQLQPGVPGLQWRHGRFVSAQTPRSIDIAPDKN
jgi:hypothetical protein